MVSYLFSAASAIKSGEYLRARLILKESMTDDMENPEAFNLLGISYEAEGNRVKAARFYRVAYYMDQAFKPASYNLDRVCMFWYKGAEDIAWGIDNDGETGNNAGMSSNNNETVSNAGLGSKGKYGSGEKKPKGGKIEWQ